MLTKHWCLETHTSTPFLWLGHDYGQTPQLWNWSPPPPPNVIWLTASYTPNISELWPVPAHLFTRWFFRDFEWSRNTPAQSNIVSIIKPFVQQFWWYSGQKRRVWSTNHKRLGMLSQCESSRTVTVWTNSSSCRTHLLHSQHSIFHTVLKIPHLVMHIVNFLACMMSTSLRCTWAIVATTPQSMSRGRIDIFSNKSQNLRGSCFLPSKFLYQAYSMPLNDSL